MPGEIVIDFDEDSGSKGGFREKLRLWRDRAVRAFRVSERLVKVREGKVKDALAEAAESIEPLTEAGLDTPAICWGKHHDLEEALYAALEQPTNRLKCEALEPVKDLARKLASDAKEELEKYTLEELATRRQIQIRLKEINEWLEKAAKVKSEICKQHAVAGSSLVEKARVVEEARDRTILIEDSVARLEALNDIDLNPLEASLAAVSEASRQYNRFIWYLETNLPRLFDNLLDSSEKTAFEYALEELRTTTKDELDALDALDALARDAKSANDEAERLYSEILNFKQQYGNKYNQLMADISWLIESAESFKYDQIKAVIEGEVLLLKQARAAAISDEAIENRLPALQAIDLSPLRSKIIECKDLTLGVPQLLKGLQAAIAKLPDTDDRKKLFEDRLSHLVARDVGLLHEADLAALQAEIAAIKKDADRLMEDIVATGSSAIYEDIIKARFGISITADKRAIYNPEKTYEMLSLLPASHVGHGRLKSIKFKGDQRGGGSYGAAHIDIGKIRDNSHESYWVTDSGDKSDGQRHAERYKVNSFNVTMLHEIGHAVDDKYGIMDGLMGNDLYGNWRSESNSSVCTAIEDAANFELKRFTMADSVDLMESRLTEAVHTLVNEALDGKKPQKPTNFSTEEWNIVKRFPDIAYKIRESESPWFNAPPETVRIGSRVYVQSYSHEWNSYGYDKLTSQKVSKYQWRAPAEWFAEIYALCWLEEIEPPAGVGPEMQKWLPQVGGTQ